METYQLLVRINDDLSLDSLAKTFFLAAGVETYFERESIHYVEERYFTGELNGDVFNVRRHDDEDHMDLPFRVDVEVKRETTFNLDHLRDSLCSHGFRVARLLNPGRVDEKRINY